ncbi:hypothetical protein [Streptomyces sp. DH37]|uniref:hypothetical protein n=1 Tax=Streptomyces sp. DH37 TaxID=3040122 RepID=UPI00244113EC|nr:hypothetical protein [Streptomyces sp. DH37]MDG9705537.1 hypothetical protein [Streptomyces sp. DH37]
MAVVVHRVESIQYDGTNGTFIATEWLTGVTLGSDDGQTLALRDADDNPISVEAGGWVIRAGTNHGMLSVHTDEQYQRQWVEVTEA